MLDHGAVGPPHAEKVDGERPLDLLDGGGRERSHEGQPGVGDRHVDPTEALGGARDGALERAEVGHVRLEPRRPIGAQARGERLQALGLEAHERDVRTLAVQSLRGRRADPPRGARDEHGAAADVEGLGAVADHKQSATSPARRLVVARPQIIAPGSKPAPEPRLQRAVAEGSRD